MATPCRGDTPAQRAPPRLRVRPRGLGAPDPVGRRSARPRGLGRAPRRTRPSHLEGIELACRLEDGAMVRRVEDERDDADGRCDVLKPQPVTLRVRGSHDTRAQLLQRGRLPRPDVLSREGRGVTDELVVLHGKFGLVGAERVALLEAKQLGEPRRARRRGPTNHRMQGRVQGRRNEGAAPRREQAQGRHTSPLVRMVCVGRLVARAISLRPYPTEIG